MVLLIRTRTSKTPGRFVRGSLLLSFYIFAFTILLIDVKCMHR